MKRESDSRQTAPASDFTVTDDLFHRPVAALDQHLRAAFEDALQRRVLVKPGHQRHTFERGDHRQALANGLTGRSSPLPSRRTEASLLSATIIAAPCARACASRVT